MGQSEVAIDMRIGSCAEDALIYDVNRLENTFDVVRATFVSSAAS